METKNVPAAPLTHNPELLDVLSNSTDTLVGKVIMKEKEVKQLEAIVVMPASNDFDTRIQINSNSIKRTLIRCDSALIGEKHLVSETSEDRDVKLVRSRFRVFDLINDGKTNKWLDTEFDEDSEINELITVLKDYDNKFKALFEQANSDKQVPFYSLPYILTEGKELAYEANGVVISFTLKNAMIRESFFGRYLQINGTIIFNDGKKFIPGSYNINIPAFDGDKTLSEIGLKDLSSYPEFRQELIDRGKRYFKLHENGPSYVSYDGNICRRSYWKETLYPATGRIIIDRAGMYSIDPDYNKYVGVNDRCYNDMDTSEEVSNKEFSDKEYLIASPYCYGFSLNAKKWGEFVIDKISDISFRTDAYSKLVLDEDLKQTMFSLVEYRGESKDIIDNKGGGCIFLLHGAPGVGK